MEMVAHNGELGQHNFYNVNHTNRGVQKTVQKGSNEMANFVVALTTIFMMVCAGIRLG